MKPSKVNVIVFSLGEGVKPADLLIDFMITIDTTPSMQYVQNTARQNTAMLVKDLKVAFPKCRIGIIFNGDLSDDPVNNGDSYSVNVLQPTDDLATISRFIKETPSTHLARGDAAYQEVLWQANNNVLWRSGAKKVMIMIGDTSPNDVHDHLNRVRRDAYSELAIAASKGIKIYAVQCPTGTRDVKFWKALASKTHGHYLDLHQFHEVLDIIKVACFNEADSDVLAAFVEFLRNSGKYTRSVDSVVSAMTGRAPQVRKSNLTPVEPSRFQIFPIREEDCESDSKIGIRDFVLNHSLVFEKGRGFYKLARTETIQHYKKIVVMDKATGDLFTGEDNVRRLLNIPTGTASVKLRDVQNLDQYDVYVQSTSVNRRLPEGSTLLYDIMGLRTN